MSYSASVPGEVVERRMWAQVVALWLSAAVASAFLPSNVTLGPDGSTATVTFASNRVLSGLEQAVTDGAFVLNLGGNAIVVTESNVTSLRSFTVGVPASIAHGTGHTDDLAPVLSYSSSVGDVTDASGNALSTFSRNAIDAVRPLIKRWAYRVESGMYHVKFTERLDADLSVFSYNRIRTNVSQTFMVGFTADGTESVIAFRTIPPTDAELVVSPDMDGAILTEDHFDLAGAIDATGGLALAGTTVLFPVNTSADAGEAETPLTVALVETRSTPGSLLVTSVLVCFSTDLRDTELDSAFFRLRVGDVRLNVSSMHTGEFVNDACIEFELEHTALSQLPDTGDVVTVGWLGSVVDWMGRATTSDGQPVESDYFFDTAPPVIANITFTPGSNLLTVTFSEPVVVSGLSYLNFTNPSNEMQFVSSVIGDGNQTLVITLDGEWSTEFDVEVVVCVEDATVILDLSDVAMLPPAECIQLVSADVYGPYATLAGYVETKYEMHFDEPITGAMPLSEWTLGPTDKTLIVIEQFAPNILFLYFTPTELCTGPPCATPTIAYHGTSIVDLSGNALEPFTMAADDYVSPRVVRYTVMDTGGLPGYIDTLCVQFSEDVNMTELDASMVTVTDPEYTINARIDSDSTVEACYELGEAGPNPFGTSGVTPLVNLFGGNVVDTAQNLNTVQWDGIAVRAEDLAPPVVVSAYAEHDSDLIDFVFSEPGVSIAMLNITLQLEITGTATMAPVEWVNGSRIRVSRAYDDTEDVELQVNVLNQLSMTDPAGNIATFTGAISIYVRPRVVSVQFEESDTQPYLHVTFNVVIDGTTSIADWTVDGCGPSVASLETDLGASTLVSLVLFSNRYPGYEDATQAWTVAYDGTGLVGEGYAPVAPFEAVLAAADLTLRMVAAFGRVNSSIVGIVFSGPLDEIESISDFEVGTPAVTVLNATLDTPRVLRLIAADPATVEPFTWSNTADIAGLENLPFPAGATAFTALGATDSCYLVEVTISDVRYGDGSVFDLTFRFNTIVTDVNVTLFQIYGANVTSDIVRHWGHIVVLSVTPSNASDPYGLVTVSLPSGVAIAFDDEVPCASTSSIEATDLRRPRVLTVKTDVGTDVIFVTFSREVWSDGDLWEDTLYFSDGNVILACNHTANTTLYAFTMDNTFTSFATPVYMEVRDVEASVIQANGISLASCDRVRVTALDDTPPRLTGGTSYVDDPGDAAIDRIVFDLDGPLMEGADIEIVPDIPGSTIAYDSDQPELLTLLFPTTAHTWATGPVPVFALAVGTDLNGNQVGALEFVNVTDGAPPVVTSVSAVRGSEWVYIHFSEPIVDTDAESFDVTGSLQTITAESLSLVNSTTLLAQFSVPLTSPLNFTLGYGAGVDFAGETSLEVTLRVEELTNTTVTGFVGAVTGDEDHDGFIDKVTLEFDGFVYNPSVTASADGEAFEVTGYTVAAVRFPDPGGMSGPPISTTVIVDLDRDDDSVEFDTAATPTVRYDHTLGHIRDSERIPFASATVSASDGAEVVVATARVRSDRRAIRLKLSEPVETDPVFFYYNDYWAKRHSSKADAAADADDDGLADFDTALVTRVSNDTFDVAVNKTVTDTDLEVDAVCMRGGAERVRLKLGDDETDATTSSDSDLSGGQIAGIVIGAVAGAGVVAWFGLQWLRGSASHVKLAEV